ncbi:hypothetical protein LJC49_05585 [Ruminococcaceae bacterium OttesenSCG-928-I18]|nr:hypothetical protein [Ruminococcaceae bacterium OttesenSCG-928-I18]
MMKKSMVLVVTVMLIAAMLSGCNGPTPAISAGDYCARLSTMKDALDAKELADISTMLIGIPKNDFDDLDGWRAEKDVNNQDIFVCSTTLNGQAVDIELGFDGNKVESVTYYFLNATADHLMDYTIYDNGVGENRRISVGSDVNSMEEVKDDGTVAERFAKSIAAKEDCSVNVDWDYTNSKGTAARIYYSFVYAASEGDMFFSLTKFSLY